MKKIRKQENTTKTGDFKDNKRIQGNKSIK